MASNLDFEGSQERGLLPDLATAFSTAFGHRFGLAGALDAIGAMT